MGAVEQIDVELTVVVGAAELKLAEVLRLGRGAVLSLKRDVSGPISILANGEPFAPAKVRLIGEKVAVEIED
ncbi:MAG: FliM/FliN family flagellar motor C-terminal domain-containing protein [Parvularculaceae bacterium]